MFLWQWMHWMFMTGIIMAMGGSFLSLPAKMKVTYLNSFLLAWTALESMLSSIGTIVRFLNTGGDDMSKEIMESRMPDFDNKDDSEDNGYGPEKKAQFKFGMNRLTTGITLICVGLVFVVGEFCPCLL